MSFLQFVLTSLAINLALKLVLWIASLIKGRVTVNDPFWGMGFTVMVAGLYPLSDGAEPRRALAAGLIGVWGLRYGIHLLTRSWGHAEASTYYPYAEWREQAGKHFWWVSWFRVFLPEGVGITVMGIPILACMYSAQPSQLILTDYIGAVIAAIGIIVEAVADFQLARFKREPSNRGTVLDTGLWRFSRHPNYFGDALMWWGIGLLGLSSNISYGALVSPVIMTIILVGFSGVLMVEKRAKVARSEAYQAYIERTSAFIPWFPKPQA